MLFIQTNQANTKSKSQQNPFIKGLLIGISISMLATIATEAAIKLTRAESKSKSPEIIMDNKAVSQSEKKVLMFKQNPIFDEYLLKEDMKAIPYLTNKSVGPLSLKTTKA